MTQPYVALHSSHGSRPPNKLAEVREDEFDDCRWCNTNVGIGAISDGEDEEEDIENEAAEELDDQSVQRARKRKRLQNSANSNIIHTYGSRN